MLKTLSDDGTYDELVAGVTSMDPPEPPLTLVPEQNLKALFTELAISECRSLLR